MMLQLPNAILTANTKARGADFRDNAIDVDFFPLKDRYTLSPKYEVNMCRAVRKIGSWNPEYIKSDLVRLAIETFKENISRIRLTSVTCRSIDHDKINSG